MSVQARIIADSINPYDVRLTTIEVTMHRFVLAEFNTHRVFSRNSASSRAIPVLKQLTRVCEDPAWPVVWASEQRGMQGGPPLDGSELFEAQRLFREVHEFTTRRVQTYLDHNPIDAEGQRRLHKSLVNRLLEPFMWHTVIASSTEWDNFWRQRCSPLAQPEIHAAADAMKEVYDASEPTYVRWGAAHTPYADGEEFRKSPEPGDIDSLQQVRSSVARCTRVSYLNHGAGKPWEDENRLVMDLLGAEPMHESPFEHVATAQPRLNTWPGNFNHGWRQLRHDPDLQKRIRVAS